MNLWPIIEGARLNVPSQERRALADYNQNLVGRGLSGSTRGAAVSAGMKSEFEDIRRGRLGDALAQLAQFLSSFESKAPTAGTISHLATGGFGGLLQEEMAGLGGRTEPTGVASRFGQGPYGTPGGGLANDPFSTFGRNSTGAGGAGGFRRGGGGSSSSGGSSSGGAGGGGAWGSLSSDISQEQGQQSRDPLTFAGMWSTFQGHDAPYEFHAVPATGEVTYF
jgi:hypothetical protein